MPDSIVNYHTPALLQESIDRLNIRPDGVYADCTLGGGGHSRAILDRLGPEGRLFGFDRDLDAMRNIPDDPRFTFVRSDFRYISNFMFYHGVDYLDGILADLGVSSHHFDTPERGFSFRFEAPLDMRMNTAQSLTAAMMLAEMEQGEIAAILSRYADLRNTQRLARAISEAAAAGKLATTTDLYNVAEPFLSPRSLKKDMAQVFQAVRIALNGEMESLEALLETAPRLLAPHGRMVVLTYHSVEDRMVKNFFRSGNADGVVESDLFGRSFTPWRTVGRNPTLPTESEVEANPRARSAKLRAAETTECNTDSKPASR